MRLHLVDRSAGLVRQWEAVFCPGMGTGVGRLSPRIAAKAMAEAYARWELKSRSRA